MPTLEQILRQQFPNAVFNPADPALGVGSFAEWDSLGTFNFLMLVESTYDVRFSPDDIAELKSLADIRGRLQAMGIEA